MGQKIQRNMLLRLHLTFSPLRKKVLFVGDSASNIHWAAFLDIGQKADKDDCVKFLRLLQSGRFRLA